MQAVPQTRVPNLLDLHCSLKVLPHLKDDIANSKKTHLWCSLRYVEGGQFYRLGFYLHKRA